MNRLPVIVLLVSSLWACADEKKRPLGATCGASTECESGLCLANECVDPAGDLDGDGLTNGVEASLTSDPTRDDTDGDGVKDGAEFGPGESPLDTDGDGLPDLIESLLADQDNDCENDQVDPTNTTPGTACPAEDADYVILNPYWGIEDIGTAAALVPGYRILEGARFTESGFAFDEECVSDGLALSTGATAGTTRTTTWCIDEVVDVPATLTPGQVLVEVPRESGTNPLGFQETTEAQTLTFSTAVANAQPVGHDLLFAQNVREYSITPPNGGAVIAQELNLFAMVKKAPISPATLEGDWGIVGLFVDVDPSTLEVEYGVGAFFAKVEPGTNPGSIQLVAQLSVERFGLQGFGGPNDQRISFGEPDPLDLAPLPMTVDNGRVRISAPEVGGSDLVGAVTPRGDVLIAASTVPEVGTARGQAAPIIDDTPERFGLELFIGLKRRLPTSAVIGGKTYRLYRIELNPAAGAFGLMSATGTLTIDEAATTATLRGDLTRWGVTTSGEPTSESLPDQELVMSVGFVEQGAFVLREPDAGPDEFTSFGFAGDDGRMLVLGDHSADGEIAETQGSFALMIATCTNCPAP